MKLGLNQLIELAKLNKHPHKINPADGIGEVVEQFKKSAPRAAACRLRKMHESKNRGCGIPWSISVLPAAM
jgi:hypothetical protein